jgi:hypothetical protein
MTKTDKLLNALQAGDVLSEAQIRSRFGIANPTATIMTLRQDGFAVYANRSKDERVTYRIGTPSRHMVATAYAVLGAYDAGLAPALAA